MNKDEEVITDQEQEVKLWRLPFWNQSPDWEAEKDKNKDSKANDVDDESLDVLELPSVEELENIRREAYNDGLEQGLIEGRQKGHQEGHEQGFNEGKQQGQEVGRNEGYQQGMQQGEEAGQASALERINPIAQRLNELVTQLQTEILERDAQLPNTITLLTMAVCEQVLKHELKTGTASIHKFVQSALAQLPEGAEDIEVQVAQEDYEYLTQSLNNTNQQLNAKVDTQLEPGVCKVKASHSLVEYSAHEHLQTILTPLAQKLLKAVDAESSPSAEQIVLDSAESDTEHHDLEQSQSIDSAELDTEHHDLEQPQSTDTTEFSIDNEQA